MTTTRPRSPVARPLLPVGRRPGLGDYLRQLWGRRHFVVADSRAKAYSGNRDMLLGNLWLVGVPILQGVVYYVIFALVLQTDRGIVNFTGFLLIGVFLFRYTTSCVTQGMTVMSASRGLITSFTFPRAAIPLSLLLRETLSMAPVLATLALLLLVVPPGTSITWTWLLFPPIFALHTMFVAGLVLYAARLGATVPDLRHLVSFLTRFWFYASGVFFSIDRFVDRGPWLAVLQNNPMYIVLDMSRDVLLYDTMPPLEHWALLLVWATITPALGFWYFWQGEEGYGHE